MGYPSDLKDKDWEFKRQRLGSYQAAFCDWKVRKPLCSQLTKLGRGHSLWGKNRVPMAYVAEGFSAVEERLWVLSAPVKARNLGESFGRFGRNQALRKRRTTWLLMGKKIKGQNRAPLAGSERESKHADYRCAEHKNLRKRRTTWLLMGKKMKGRKRHIVVETQGSLHQAILHAKNIRDSKDDSKDDFKGGAVLSDIVLR